MSFSKQSQNFSFGVESLDVRDYISKKGEKAYLVESNFIGKSEDKKCFKIMFSNDITHPKSDLSLSLYTNCQIVVCTNFNTIFTITSCLGDAANKEEVELSYYKDFANAMLAKIDQYIQLGLDYAVIKSFHIIF